MNLEQFGVQSDAQYNTENQAQGQSDDQIPNDKIQKVITMLENLVAEMDAEAATDEKQFAEFSAWCTETKTATEQSISQLTAQIEELKASLADLYAQKTELETQIQKLDDQITTCKEQMETATEKRQEEHNNFNKEQIDFDNSIAACNKAVTLLSDHYGTGEVETPEKPSWMSFVQVKSQLRTALSRGNNELNPLVSSFLSMDSPQFDRYQAKTTEGLNIVDQMKILGETFQEDKQSAIDEENRLQKMYDELMKEKAEMLASLTAERNERQGVLNQVNQDIAEQETAKANAESELKDEQAYLAQTSKTCADTAALFEMRKKDRAEEKLAVQEAIKVLQGPAGEFVQVQATSFLQTRARTHASPRDGQKLRRVTALLSEAAQELRSSTLATAAAATQGTDAVKDVVNALKELLKRIDEEQLMENQHKAWCEQELSAANEKKTYHEGMVATLTDKIANEKAVIEEKQDGLVQVAASIKKADEDFAELTRIRGEEKQAYDVELQNYIDALAALNQAINILAKFYAAKEGGGSFIQESDRYGLSPKAIQPGVFDNAYEKKGGTGVIEMIATVRKEFEQGKADLIKAEDAAIKNYNDSKEAYNTSRRELVATQDKLTVELQTAQANLAQFEEDKKSNEAEVIATTEYLKQLSGSCDSLLANFDKRVELRKEEKGAINQAIKVLEEEA
jgi:DNA repair exonuclease SbcCD ATPase subunit